MRVGNVFSSVCVCVCVCASVCHALLTPFPTELGNETLAYVFLHKKPHAGTFHSCYMSKVKVTGPKMRKRL